MNARNMIIKLAAAAIAAATLMSCGQSQVKARLSDIESFINERPDSALAALRAIDTLDLRTRAEKAKFSLLHAMALDKNYIDTADTRVVMPAVDYYSRHGSPEERLKAYMYLGTERFNAGLYNQAIVDYNQSLEQFIGIKDLNLQGVLYSKIAQTFSKSQDYVQANDYLDKAIKCFEECQRPDQRNLTQIMKAVNLIWMMEWEESEDLFHHLLSDDSLSPEQVGTVEGYYAMMILYNPSLNDTTALSHFEKALASGGHLESFDEYCAYAYLLGAIGREEEANLLFNEVDLSDYNIKYSHDYWRHRLSVHDRNYKKAYQYLWSAQRIVDSITRVNHSLSASNAQRVQMESLSVQRQLKIQNQRWMILAISLLSLLVLAVTSTLFLIRRRKGIDEHNRMEIVIDYLNRQINEIKAENHTLVKEKSKARFAVIASLFEDVYHLIDSDDTLPKEKLYEIVNERIKILGDNEDAQIEFEKALNKESKEIMASFRNDYPNLSPEEYRLASCVFAGFDNTTIMLIMGITTLEYTRVKKNRLKSKILKHPTDLLGVYLNYF